MIGGWLIGPEVTIITIVDSFTAYSVLQYVIMKIRMYKRLANTNLIEGI
jgi:hypothetical protein